jgi:hypothetical protein
MSIKCIILYIFILIILININYYSIEGFINSKNIYVFYHIYCNKYTLDIVKEQTSKIIFSGLYDEVTHVYCFLTGESDYINIVTDFIGTLPSKFKVEAVGLNDTTYERFTLTKISTYITDNDKFLYIHSKGVSDKNNENMNDKLNVRLWANFMEYYLIKGYKECLEALEKYDIVGTMYTHSIPPVMTDHYAGNFWWSTGKYYKKLTSMYGKIGNNYYEPESYIFKGEPNHYEIDNNVLGPSNSDKLPYTKSIYPNRYI